MAKSQVNHDRLDRILSWAALLQTESTCAAELEGLRAIGVLMGGQRKRAEHLEWHLLKGDVICECYETVAVIER